MGAVMVAALPLSAVACTVFCLREFQTPAGAFGGVPFTTQPRVAAVEADLSTICNALDGTTVTARIGLNPSRWGTVTSPTLASAVLVDGWANFTDLEIDLVGVNYTLVYEGSTRWDEGGRFDVAMGPPTQLVITQQPGSITGGTLFRPQPALEIQDAGGNVWTGDSASRISVAIGDNPGGGTLSYEYDVLGQEHWGTWKRARCVLGHCPFQGLSIDKAGINYTLTFTLQENAATHNLPAANRTVTSNYFTVGIGDTHHMTVEQQPAGARGGQNFTTQPIIALRDKGGNINVHDSTSRVTASFAVDGNPSGSKLQPQYVRTVLPNATVVGYVNVTQGSPYVYTSFDATAYISENDLVEIGEPVLNALTGTYDSPYTEQVRYPEAKRVRIVPDAAFFRLQDNWAASTQTFLPITLVEDGLTVQVVNGIATYQDLRIDRVGRDFELRFTVSHLQPTHTYTKPGIYVDSDDFDVVFGVPAQLNVLQPAGGAWAGGQPFGVQPIIAIQDAGGNTLTDIIETHGVIIVQASLIDTSPNQNATLLGNVTCEQVLGICEFKDLEVDIRGYNYTMRYNTTIGDFTTEHRLHVAWSGEWQVMPSDRYRGDEFGQAVDVDGDLAVVGAHREDRLVREVQTVTTVGTSFQCINEIQSVRTQATWREMVQVIHSRADSGAIGGTFNLGFNGGASSTIELPYDCYPELMKVHLENDLSSPETGEVTVTRSDNTGSCGGACTGAYSWTVTFHHLSGPQPLLDVDFTSLTTTGTNATMFSQMQVPSVIINGTFTLTIPEGPLTGGGALTTRPIPHDVHPDVLADFIEADLLTGTGVTVTRTGPDAQLGYVWSVTFVAQAHNYDVPQMVADASGLSGHGAAAWVHTQREGLSPLGGKFRLSFRGAGPTVDIPYDASANAMEAALEGLATIDTVWVTRSGPDAQKGYSWTITFVQVRHSTLEGSLYSMDPLIVNLEGLVAVTQPYTWSAQGVGDRDAMLTGTGHHVEIDYLYSITEDGDAPWDPIMMGKTGDEAGAAYVFQRNSERWLETHKLRGSDTGDFDHFGFSTAIDDTTIIVGAPGAQDPGTLEVQLIKCIADGGSFVLEWHGHTTAPIQWNANAAAVEAALEALPPLHDVIVNTQFNPSDQVCSTVQHVTQVTFVMPQDGNQPALVPRTQYDPTWPALPPDGLLIGVLEGTLTVTDDYVPGTRKPHGADSTTDMAVGAAYVFWYNASANAWDEHAKLMDSLDRRAITDSFGWDVALDGDVAIVSAPYDVNKGIDGVDAEKASGSVFVFQRSGDGVADWAQHQLLTQREPDRNALDRFGHAIALDDDMIVISALGWDSGQGRVYVFKRHTTASTFHYLMDQMLDAPTGSSADPVAQFGADVSVHQHAMLIGAPGARGALDNEPTGLAYAYDRIAHPEAFVLRQTLRPTPAKVWERVGLGVEIDNHTLVVSSLQNYKGPRLGPRHEVHLIQTTATTGIVNNTIGNTFRLGWRRGEDGGLIYTREIESDALASTLRQILIDDLGTGPITVRRLHQTAEKGYRWFVTFVGPEPEHFYAQDARYPLFTPKSSLTGVGARVDTSYVNVPPPPIYGQAYVYTRSAIGAGHAFGNAWQEQLVAKPFYNQIADRFGAAVGLQGSTLIVGAPNRDYFVSSENSGAAFMFDLAILNLRWSEFEYPVPEDDDAYDLTIMRCSPYCRYAATPPLWSGSVDYTQLVQVSMVDGDDWGVYRFPPSHTVAGTSLNGFYMDRQYAIGRADCRYPFSANTSDCLWTPSSGNPFEKSAYDYDAVSDFAPYHAELTFDATGDAVTTQAVTVHITDDKILEAPDEIFHVRLWAPGMQPVLGGDLWTTVTIEDDGDGGVGSRGYYEKMYAAEEPADTIAEGQFGAAVALDDDLLIVGAPHEDDGAVDKAGNAYAFYRVNGIWTREGALPRTATALARFGMSVAVDATVGMAAVGIFGPAQVGIYRRTGTATWVQDATVTPSAGAPWDPVRAHHGFAGTGTLAMSGYVVCCGARGLESVFCFRGGPGNSPVWAQTAMLRASDYQEMVWLTTRHQWRQGFGASLAMSGSTLVIGAPYGNYATGDLATPTNYDDVVAMDDHAYSHGSGKVYVWEFNETADSTQYDGGDFFNWFEMMKWAAADQAVAAGEGQPHFVDDTRSGIWAQQDQFSAFDAKPRDRFGEAVAIDGHQMIVGSWGNPGQPIVTWDFETGDLRGWSKTGYAFDLQPTFGDNTAWRTAEVRAEGGVAQASGLRGRYFIGTAEARSHNASTTPTPAHNMTLYFPFPGRYAGDLLQGTLTSDPFRIAGDTISLLVGGGCNERLEYVELIVDGVADARATGACEETMRRVHWDVSFHKGRSAQIRIVDASSDGWGHINVDDIRFSWDMQAWIETPVSGAAYAFRRRENGTEEPCTDFNLMCTWEHQQKLVAGDKRPGVKFGFSVAVDDETGTAVVGAPLHMSVRPDWGAPGSTAGVQIPGGGYSFRADGGINNGDVGGHRRTLWGADKSPYLRDCGTSGGGRYNIHGRPSTSDMFDRSVLGGSGANSASGRMFTTHHEANGINTNLPWDRGNPYSDLGFGPRRSDRGDVRHPNDVAQGGDGPNLSVGPVSYPTGVAYVFRRIAEIRDGYDRLLFEPHWPAAHHSVLAFPGAKPQDGLGGAVSVDGFTAVFGAPRDSTTKGAAGSVHTVDTEYQRIYFEFDSYVVVEGYHWTELSIRVFREGDLSGSLDVAYSTRDITAFGMNASQIVRCERINMNVDRRTKLNDCGDYAQTHGVLHFLPTEVFQTLYVTIVNDFCREEEPERFVVQLAVPGEVPILGEGYSTVVRIDDDDGHLPKCVHPDAFPDRDSLDRINFRQESTPIGNLPREEAHPN